LVAGLSHAAVLIPMFGVIIPLIVFFTQKDRSNFLKKQSLQATVWQLLALLGYFLMGACYMVGFFFMFPLGFLADSEAFSSDPARGGVLFVVIFMIFMLLMLAYMVGWLVYLGFGIAGGVQMLRGKDFQYPFIGKWIDRRLESNEENQIEEKSEEESSKGEENDN
jgi:uncharacterized Tic20 family protein